MKRFLSTFLGNLAACFQGRMILWHLLAIALTLVLVLSGFDWKYYLAMNTPEIRRWLVPAGAIGFIVPIYLPLSLLLAGYLTQGARCLAAGFAIAQAEILGSLISSTYKAFTGRAHPLQSGIDDITREFRFGFMRGGAFWGWPSSHTTIAFAMAFTVCTLLPKQRWLGAIAILYALYIGIGVSTTIHWFSDFVAGAILGTLIGTVVGRSFRKPIL